MDNRIPNNLEFLFQKYIQLLHKELGDSIYGIYIYGSLALGSYSERTSNIDFLTVVDKRLNENDILRIQKVHKSLRKFSPYANAMEGEYVYLPDIIEGKPEKHYPYFAYGKYRGDVPIRDFNWFQLKHSGIVIYGTEFDKIAGSTNWTGIKRELGRDLNDNWIKVADKYQVLMLDEWISMVVLTLCRIFYTLEREMVISKSGGGRYALESIGSEWHTLINEALRIQNKSSEVSMYPSKVKRLHDTKEFIRYMVDFCNSKYQLEYL